MDMNNLCIFDYYFGSNAMFKETKAWLLSLVVFYSYDKRHCSHLHKVGHGLLYINPSNAGAAFVQNENHLNPVMLVFIGKLSLSEYLQMSTHLPGFQSFFRVFA